MHFFRIAKKHYWSATFCKAAEKVHFFRIAKKHYWSTIFGKAAEKVAQILLYLIVKNNTYRKSGTNSFVLNC